MCSTPPNLPVRGMLKNIRWRYESAYICRFMFVCDNSPFLDGNTSHPRRISPKTSCGNGPVFLKKHLHTECKPLIHLRFPRLQSDYLDCASMANHPSLFLQHQKSILPFSKLQNVAMKSDDLMAIALKSNPIVSYSHCRQFNMPE